MQPQPRTAARFLPLYHRFAGGLAAFWLLSAALLAQDPAAALESSLIKIIEQAEPSVVSIAVIRQPPTDIREFHQFRPLERMQEPQVAPTNPEDPDFQPNHYGAGIIVSGPRANEKLVLTNYHVVQKGPISPAVSSEDGSYLYIRFADRRGCYASIIAADPRTDLAMLRLLLDQSRFTPPKYDTTKFNTNPNGIEEGDLKPLDWTTSTSPVKKGQFVVMLGNPYALAQDGSASASWGMVSNMARRPLPWTSDRIAKFMMYRLGNLIQIDGRLNLGTSGGPLLNLKGELIGLTTSLAAVEGYEKSAGFAIPIDDVTRRVVKTLAMGQEVEYGMLGIFPTDVTPTQFHQLDTGLKQTSAARVSSITKDAPASRAGIRKDDIILSVADTPVHSENDLMRIVGLYPPESEVEVVVWRPGRQKPFPVTVTLGKWPVWEDERIIETSPRFPAWRGITVDYPTGRRKYTELGGETIYRNAVVVTKVAPDSPAQLAGVQPGIFISEVNRTIVQTPGGFHDATKSLKGKVELRLYDGSRIEIGE